MNVCGHARTIRGFAPPPLPNLSPQVGSHDESRYRTVEVSRDIKKRGSKKSCKMKNKGASKRRSSKTWLLQNTICLARSQNTPKHSGREAPRWEQHPPPPPPPFVARYRRPLIQCLAHTKLRTGHPCQACSIFRGRHYRSSQRV